MCGIVGLVGRFNSSDLLLEKMKACLWHRGPDQNGSFVDRNASVFLGHTRLSILDLSERGQQPMLSASAVVVLNGEIYNFKQLRKELARKYLFKSTTDTEVLLHGYEEWGIERLVQKLKGMFAFAIYDRREKILHLARDRMGEKPLYYYVGTQGEFAFSSELKALQYIPQAQIIDPVALDLYFTFGYIPAPHSIVKNVYKLEPGYRISFQAVTGKREVVKYWQLNFEAPKQNIKENEAKEKLENLLTNSIDISMSSDVPLGVFLSGGLDSSLICAIACKTNSSLRTFSVVYGEPSFDESKYSRLVADFLETNHTELHIGTSEVQEVITTLDGLVDEPMSDMSLVPTHILAKKAREYVTVVLGGDGADELFSGYPTQIAHKLSGYYVLLPKLLRKRIIEKIIHALPVSFRDFSLEFQLKRFVSSAALQPEHRHFLWQAHIPFKERSQIYLNSVDSENIFKQCLAKKPRNLSVFELVEYLDLTYYLPNDILAKVDIAAMACSLETRSPYLDFELVEFAQSLPEKFKFRLFRQKYILKKLSEYFLPKEIIYRKKHGFGVPIGQWLRDDLYDYAHDLLCSNIFDNAFAVNKKFVNRLLHDHRSGKKDNRKQIWSLIVLANWMRSYGIA